MNNKNRERSRATDLKSAIRGLHDDLKRLALTCAPSFPKEAIGGLDFLTDLVDLQVTVAAYERELLVRVFHLADHGVDGVSSVLGSSGEFIRRWNERRSLSNQEDRTENEVDTSIRRQVSYLLEKMRLLSEEELRTIDSENDIPEMLYYLSTVEQSLCWYTARYLARLTGDLAQAEP